MISGYRLMWLLVMFDLPVETKQNRRDYRRFVDKLEDDGYHRVQFSIYVRPCATDENTVVHQNRLMDWLPPEGEVRILRLTDKQWGRMAIFRERVRADNERAPEQFLFFDEDGEVLVDEQAGPDVVQRAQVDAAEKKYPVGDKPGSFAVVMETLSRLEKRGKPRKASSPKPTTPSFDFFDG